jgi:5-methylcytosine-specific restriction endonuclease McrA
MKANLTDPVLVLNRSWVAVNVATVRRALILLYCDVARVVLPEDYSTYSFGEWLEVSARSNGNGNGNGNGHIHSARLRICVPEVIVLADFNGRFAKEVRCTRRHIFERDGNVCQYCGRKREPRELTLDHVVPRSRGGSSSWENIVIACLDCNSRKGDRLPQESGMRLLTKPVKPGWATRVGLKVGPLRRASWARFLQDGSRPPEAAG